MQENKEEVLEKVEEKENNFVFDENLNRLCVKPKDVDYKAIVKKKGFTRFCKRGFDICASFFGLLLLSPILLIVAIIIKCSSKGPVFFKQTRVGRDGKEFKIFKFRTMIVDAESKGMQITVGDDKRITGIGKFLRKTKLDEFPQLINVFIGQMSLVGPRPEVPRYVEKYSEYEKNVLLVRPGITELSSIVYRNENEVLDKAEDPEYTYENEIMPTKLEINIDYINKMGFWYDIGLIFKTFIAILKG